MGGDGQAGDREPFDAIRRVLLEHSAVLDLRRFPHPHEQRRRLAEGLCERVGVRGDQAGAETSKAQRHAPLQAVKRWSPPVRGTRGFDPAEVTAGGVALDEIDPATMESRLHKGLFVAGEILDVDGPIGGFNFQAALSTGHAAGLAV